LSLCLFFLPFTQAQKVGLVLSGGGAKGMTHIGIIRALEENNIPIDYITGTSMGAIIGSLYAMGYSPDDMEALLRSEDFKRWYSGQIEPEYGYYFKQNRPTPEFFNIRFSFKDSLHIKPQILPTSMVNPIQMNLVFVELFARATAALRSRRVLVYSAAGASAASSICSPCLPSSMALAMTEAISLMARMASSLPGIT